MTILDALPFGTGILLAGLIGLLLGSFIATLVRRWPEGRSLLGRSQCDGCGRALGVRDLVPLVSAALSRGRCRTCGAAIDPFHGRVELASALIGAAALALLPGAAGWLWTLFGWLLLPLALLDARHFWLPDRLTLILAVAGLLFAGPMLGVPLIDRWLGAIVGGLAMALLAWTYARARGRDGMGGGDPKLVAATGAWLGWQVLPLMLLLASLAGILWALAQQRKGDRPLGEQQVPFGAFLCGAAFVAVPLSDVSRRKLTPDDDGHRAAVLRPGFLVRSERGGTFLAIADDADPRRIDAERGEVILCRIGAALTKRDIIVTRAAFIGMAFQRDADGGVALQPLCLASQRRLILCIDIILVEVEKDAVRCHVRDEIFLRTRNDSGAGSSSRVRSSAFGCRWQRVRGLFRAGANRKHGDRRHHGRAFAYRHVVCPLVVAFLLRSGPD